MTIHLGLRLHQPAVLHLSEVPAFQNQFVEQHLGPADFEDSWEPNPRGFPNVLKAALPIFELIPAVRDVSEIRELSLPVFAKLVTPQAGEPKGLGEIGVAITIEGVTISPGDWIVADDDGIMVVESRRAAEITNRAMDCLERENRIRQDITSGKSTLGKVMDLLRWEKK